MNEFWALILGSALAVVGGIVGTLFTQWMNNRNEKQKDKKLAYLKILDFCNRTLYSEIIRPNKELIEELAKINTLVDLYASKSMQASFNNILDLIFIDYKNQEFDMKEVEKYIDKIVKEIKISLNIKTEKEKEKKGNGN